MTALADREWRIVREERRPGPMQMALDEIAAETAAAGGPRTVRVYTWEPATFSLGYTQDPASVDWDRCEREGITATRRPTGGGGIYHDTHGDISYSITAPATELPGDLMDCYDMLCGPLFTALSRLGIDAYYAESERPPLYEPACYLRGLHPAHDVLAGDGRKISGNAQYRRRESVIQHGSLTYERAVDAHLGVFTDPPEPATFRDRVTSVCEQVGVDRAEAVATLEDALAEWADASEGAWTDAELDRARERAAEKYETEAWTERGEAPAADAE